MNKMKLIENGLREWTEQVERRRKEIVMNPDLIDQEMVICLDVGELSRAELLDVEIFLDLLDDENNDLIVEEHYGDYTDQSGTVYRLRLLKEIVRDNLVDEYEYKNGILRIAVSYCFRYHRFDGGFDYCDITKEMYEEIVDNFTEAPDDEYIGYGDESDDPDDEWDDVDLDEG
ncbi:hypothetical protein IKE82_01205 [Candidatus Saccharibacteria bacterium]|nr:hypothetical protein [Candidatus Saccharibacteria bacterium]